MGYWKSLYNEKGAHYNIFTLIDNNYGIDVIKEIFPEGKKSVNCMNFILFSTSGVHGTYNTIEDVESGECDSLTILIIHPRIVCMKYGEIYPKTKEDFKLLKELRKASWDIVKIIGK